MMAATIPTLDDYPRGFIADGRPGEERRRTIDGEEIGGSDDRAAGAPLVTIITVVFNNARHIERAMQSVFAQSYRRIEYIVVDGGSTDGTVERIARHADRLSYWHSARDGGIADAFNRGVALARGDLIGLVNSDDWLSPDQIAQAVAALESTGASFVFGDLIYHRSEDGAAEFRLAGDPSYAGKLWHRMPHVTHPTAVVRQQVYADYGLFDRQWKIGMDYDWLYRLHRHGVEGAHSPLIVGHMSLGGVSDQNFVRSLKEQRNIGIVNGSPKLILNFLFLTRITKIRVRLILAGILPPKAIQFMRRWLNPAITRA